MLCSGILWSKLSMGRLYILRPNVNIVRRLLLLLSDVNIAPFLCPVRHEESGEIRSVFYQRTPYP